MKKRLLSIAALLASNFAINAQVGIGTSTPNKSAELLIASKNRGLLIPNVSLINTKDKTTITNGNVESLLVYANVKQNDINPGYYYWYDDRWVRLTDNEDIPTIVVNTFAEILKMESFKVQNLIIDLVKSNAGNVYYDGASFSYINNQGNKVFVSIADIIKANETVTTLVNHGNGTYTYTNENGVTTIVDVPHDVVQQFTNIVNKPVTVNNRNFTSINEYIQHIVDKFGGFTKIVYDNTGQASFQKWNDASNQWINVDNSKFKKIVQANETVTVLISNADGSFTYFNENQIDINGQPLVGAVGVRIDPKEVDISYNHTTKMYEFKNSDGVVIGSLDTNANAIAFNNSASGLSSTNVQGAIDEIMINLVAKSDSLVDNGNGLYTHITANGEELTFDVNKVNVSEKTGPTGEVIGYDFKDSNGAVITTVYTAASNNYYNNSTSGLSSTNVQGAIDEIMTNLVAKSDSLVDNGNGLYTHITANGEELTFDVNKVNVSEKTGPTGEVIGYDFKYANGAVITTVYTAASNNYYNNSTSGLSSTNVQGAIDEIMSNLIDKSDSLVDNLNGTYTHITANGEELTFDVNKVNVSEKTGPRGEVIGYDFKYANGAVITTVYTAASNNYYNNSASGLSSTNVQGAIDEIMSNLIDKSDSLVDNLNGTYTHITANGEELIIDANTTSVIVENEVYTFLNGKGETITSIDTNASAIGFDDTKSSLGADNVQDAIDKLANTISTTKGDLSLAGGLEFTAQTDGTAKLLADAGIQIADSGVTTDKIANNAVTAEKLFAGEIQEDIVRIPVADKDGNVTYQNSQDLIQSEQKTVILQHGINTTVESSIDLTNNNQTNWKINVPTAQGAKNDVASVLGLVKEAPNNPTVLISSEGELSVNNAVTNSIKTIAGAYSVLVQDAILLGNASATEVVITLPTPTVENKGKKYTIKKQDTNEDNYVTVVGTIEGATQLYTALPYSGWDLVSDGSQWQIVNKF